MTLPASGTISLSQVLGELQIGNPSRTNPISLGDTDVRTLAGVPSGAISLSNLYGKSGGAGLGASTTNGFKSVSSVGSGGTAIANPSVSAFGGTPPYSYLWTFTSNPDTCTLGSATSATCSVSKAYSVNTNGSASAVLQCVITDSTGGTPLTVTKTGIQSNIVWSNGA